MDISVDAAINAAGIINSNLSNKNNLIALFKDAIQNKHSKTIQYFWKNFITIILLSLGLTVLFNRNYLQIFTSNQNLIVILNYVFYTLAVFPLFVYLDKIKNIFYLFSKEVRYVKRQKYVSELEEFEQTRTRLKEYRKNRWFILLIDLVLPSAMLFLNIISLLNQNLGQIIVSVIVTLLLCLAISKRFQHYFSNTVKTIGIVNDKDLIKNATYFVVDGTDYFYKKNTNTFYYNGEDLIELQLTESIFNIIEAKVIYEYCLAMVPLMKKFQKTKFCKDKKGIDDAIASLQKTADCLEEIVE